MSGCNKSPKSDQHSIKYALNRCRGVSIEADLSCVNYKPSLPNNDNKKCYPSSELKSPELLTTAQLISAVGQLWDSASRPLSFLLQQGNVKQDGKGFPIKKIPDATGVERNGGVRSSNSTNYLDFHSRANGYGSPTVKEKLYFPRVAQKVLILESGSQDYIHSLFRRFLQASDNNLSEHHSKMELGSEKIFHRSGDVYWWMRKAHKGIKYHVGATDPENLKNSSPLGGGCISIDTSTPALTSASDACNLNLVILDGLPLSNDAILDTGNVSPLCSDYYLHVLPDTKADVSACQTSSSSIFADYHINSLATFNSSSAQCQHKADDNELLDGTKGHFSDITDDEPKVQSFYATLQKPCYSIAKQEHAFSGALAGVCVSLCLHPVDTIKTVIQSCRAEQRSIFYIGKSIVSDRG